MRLFRFARNNRKDRVRTSFVFSRSLGVALILSAFLALPVLAKDSEVSRATLAGLQGVRVVVEEVQPNIQKYAVKFGLSAAEIR